MFSEYTSCEFNDNFNCMRLTDIFESFDDMVFIIDDEGKILKSNSAASKKLGYSISELENLNMLDIRNPKYIDEVKIKLTQLFNGNTNVCEIPLMTKDNKEIPITAKVHIGHLSFSNKKIAYVFCKDLSVIRNYEDRLNKIFSSNAYAVSITDITTGTFMDVNDKFIEMLGFTKNEIIGNTSINLSILSINDRNILIDEMKVNGTVRNLELKYGMKNGQTRYGEFSGDFVKIDGEDYLLLVVVDINDKKENIENYLALLNAMPYLMVRVREDFMILDVKPGADEYLSDPMLKELVGKDISDLPSDNYIIEETKETIKKVIGSGEIDEHQYSMNIGNSDKRYFHARTAKNGDDEAIIMIRDTTDEVNLSNDLRASKEYAENLIEISNAIFVEMDIEGNILKFNETAERITGYKKDYIIGKNWFDIMIPNDKKGEMSQFLNKIKLDFSDEEKKHENEIITKNGEIKYIVWRNNIIKNGKNSSIVSFGIDMTERKIFEEELIKAKIRAEESDKMKLEFLANMSHDLRTPMNAIIGFSDLLKANNISKSEKSEYVNTITNNGKFLMTLIDDIIDVSKIDTNSLKIDKRDFEINKLLEELRLSYTKQIRDKNIDIVIQEDVNKNVIVNTDKYRMRQILMNLIGNAIKFTKDGYVKFGYRIIDDEKLEVFVEDTGIGISKENQKIIFERFKQLSSTGHKFKGAGLGLSITKSLIKLLGFDDIKLISTEGKGSKFYFQIPYTLKKFDYVIDYKEKENKKSINLKGKTILVVEDDKDSRYIISKHLFKTNVGIIECDDGDKVMGIIRDNKIDLVLLDIGLPGKSGYKLIKDIKGYDERLPIIVESALAMPDQKMKAYDLGADDYITKPFSQNDLLFKIDRLI